MYCSRPKSFRTASVMFRSSSLSVATLVSSRSSIAGHIAKVEATERTKLASQIKGFIRPFDSILGQAEPDFTRS